MAQGFPPQGGYGAPPQGGYGAPPQGGSYEFGPTENEVVGTVGKRAATWGSVSIVLGVFQVLSAFAQMGRSPAAALIPLVSGVVAVIVGVAFQGVGKSFKAVVETQGNDIANLLQALRGLDRALLTQLVAVPIGFVIGFCVGIASAVR